MPPGTEPIERLKAEGSSLKSLFLCAKGVMLRYNISRRTLYRRLADGRLPKTPRFHGHVWRVADLVAAESVGSLKT